MQHGIYEIDLHGLSMTEAKMVLDEVFEYLAENSEYTELVIIVGVGKGSETGPVLPAFVSNYLTAKGYESITKHGVLHVTLK